LHVGHQVTAFARNPSALAPAPGLTIAQGDAMNEADVARAMTGHDAVVVTLGNSQNPFGLLFGARRTTPHNICEIGTRNIIAAMKANGIARLIVVSSFGVGDTKAQAPLLTKIFYALFLREQMADKEKQEPLVKASGLDWTLVQPVGLTDGVGMGGRIASPRGETGKLTIPRSDVAAFIAAEFANPAYRRATVTLSGAKA
jgi:putative NADH-flavin reductase